MKTKIKIIIAAVLVVSFIVGFASGMAFGSIPLKKSDAAESAVSRTAKENNKNAEKNETTEKNLKTDLSSPPDRPSGKGSGGTIPSESDTTTAPETTEAAAPEREADYIDDVDYSDDIADLFSTCGAHLGTDIDVMITADSASSELNAYIKSGTEYRKLCSCQVWFGYNGVTGSKKEGDGCTPLGLYDIGTAFGIEGNPGTAYPYKQATENSYWVDDPGSDSYNRWVELESENEEHDWYSAERILDYPGRYDLGLVIEYNTANTIPGKGSAIFLHCGTRTTSGCVSVSYDNMRKILTNLNADDTVQILIY